MAQIDLGSVLGPKGDQGVRGSRWYAGTGVTGTSTTAAVFPSSGVASALTGDLYLNTTSSNVYTCTLSGGASVAKWAYLCNIKGTAGETETPGTIKAGMWTAAPSGYLLCQGQAVSRTAYSALFALLGTKFGSGNGSTTFHLPDLRGKTLAGYQNGDTLFGTLGGSVGETSQELVALIGNVDNNLARVGWNAAGASVQQYAAGRWVQGAEYYDGTITAVNNATQVKRADNTDPSLIQPTVTVNYAIKY